MANRKTAKKHALRRLKSRSGIKDINEANLLAENAYKFGVRLKDLPKNHPVYLAYAHRSNTYKKKARLYDGRIFIFNDNGELITTYFPNEVKEGVNDE